MLTNIQNDGWLNSGAIQWVEEVLLEDYRDYLNMDAEEITDGSDREINFESDNNNIWIWMFLFDMNFLLHGS